MKTKVTVIAMSSFSPLQMARNIYPFFGLMVYLATLNQVL